MQKLWIGITPDIIVLHLWPVKMSCPLIELYLLIGCQNIMELSLSIPRVLLHWVSLVSLDLFLYHVCYQRAKSWYGGVWTEIQRHLVQGNSSGHSEQRSQIEVGGKRNALGYIESSFKRAHSVKTDRNYPCGDQHDQREHQMIQLNRTTIWTYFSQYIYKYMALKLWSLKCFEQYILKIIRLVLPMVGLE